MRRLFLSPEQFVAGKAHIVGPDHLHLARVLRARVGEKILLLDGTGNAFEALLTEIGKTETLAEIVCTIPLPPEPVVALTVAQALGKGDKLEQVIQHGTEAGASAFLPVRAERCVSDVPAAKIADRVARWRQIAKGAAEQSGRAIVPGVGAPLSFGELLRFAESQAIPGLLLHPEAEASSLRAALEQFEKSPAHLLLAVGPEGGWSPAEVVAAQAANIIPVSLGAHILRTETAALVALSQICYHFEK